MNKILFLIICLLFWTSAAFTQLLLNENNIISRTSTYLTKLETAGFAGSVLIGIKDKVILSDGYGFKNIEQNEKNTPLTIYDIGSITKQFTAAAILKLEMQDKLSTNDKISLYFKNVPEDKLNITIHDLLRHQSGLVSNVGGDYDRITETAFIDSVMKSTLQFQTGTSFSYSNIGYSLLAKIIEKVSGKSYEEYLSENLFTPAGMESTGYSLSGFNRDQIASGYKNGELWGKPTEKEWDNGSPFWHLKGNGGILSTTEDLFKWHQALLSDHILSDKAKEKYYHPRIRENEDTDSYYAYGWDIHKTDRNTTLIWHNGYNGIFYADFSRFIDEGVVIISLSNQAHRNFMTINKELAKIIFIPSYVPEIPIADNEANRDFTKKIISIISEKGLNTAKEIYLNRDKGLNILESEINTKGYELLSKNKIDEALEFFEMNIFAFPKSANAYDSLAEANMEQGNKESAIKYYKKSLSLDPGNTNAEEMLNKLNK